MPKNDSTKAVDDVLAKVNNERRGFLKGLLLGSAALAALPLLNSQALAQDGGDAGKGGDDDAAKGKGKGDGGDAGKGDGGDAGKGSTN